MLYYGLEQHSLDSYFQFKELGSAPSTPTTNEIRLYAKDDGSGVSTLCYKNDAGTEICLPTSGSFVTGTGVANRVAFWSGTSTLSSDADLTFVTDTLTATKIVAPTSITISTLTAGSLIFAGAAGLLSQDNANLFWDDSSNLLGLGTVTPGTAIHIVKDNLGAIQLDALTTAFAPTFNGRAYRTSAASPSVVQADDVLASFGGAGKITTGFSAAKAAMQMKAGETWSDTAQGSYISFLTTALTTTTRSERFRIGPSGQWGIGGATFGTAGQYFRSGGASAAPTWATITGSEITGAALTKTDDTNVTLTLGGSASTALLNAASLTLGWTGTLGVSRGGTGTGTAFTQGSVVFAGASGVYSQDNSGFFYDATNHRLGVGTSSPASELNVASISTSAARGIISDQYSADAAGATIIGRKTRGASVGAFTAVNSGDTVCSFRSHSSDGSGFLNGFAFLRTLATETQSSTAQGTKVQIQTVATGGTTAAIALELGADKGVILPQTTSYLDLTAISAGNPNLKVTATSDTPATTWTAGTPSNNPAGFIEIVADGSTRYIPFWT